jgi:hypothetical protein
MMMMIMIEAASTSEKSVNFYQATRRNIPEDSHHHTRRRDNLKSHLNVNLHGVDFFNHKANVWVYEQFDFYNKRIRFIKHIQFTFLIEL